MKKPQVQPKSDMPPDDESAETSPDNEMGEGETPDKIHSHTMGKIEGVLREHNKMMDRHRARTAVSVMSKAFTGIAGLASRINGKNNAAKEDVKKMKPKQ